MLEYDVYLLAMTMPLVLGGVYFWFCEDTQRVLFDNGSVAFDEDCCCCPPCSDCDNNPPPYGWVTFSGVVATDPQVCAYCTTSMNNTSFEVECSQTDDCFYVASIPAGTYCGYDRLKYWINNGSDNVQVVIEDDEPSPDQRVTFYKSASYPLDCEDSQTSIPYRSTLSDDESCDWSSATASFDPYCFPGS